MLEHLEPRNRQQAEQSIEFELIPAQQYHTELVEAVPEAARFVLLQAMGFNRSEATAPILDAALAGQQREKSRTLVLPDSYSKLYTDEAVLWSPKKSQRRAVVAHNARMREYLDNLQEAGGHGRYVHPYMGQGRRLNMFPLAGRNHAKISRVDDVVWTFGGVNFTALSFANHDYMLRAESPELAKVVTDYALEHLETGRSPRKENICLQMDPRNKLIIDVGLPGKSAIYDEAVRLSSEADGSMVFVSQFAPEGSLRTRLNEKQSQLGPDNVRVVFNNHDAFGFPVNLEQLVMQNIAQPKHETVESGYLHAKFMIFRYADGRRLVLTGSNNLNVWGVRFGTAEIALLSSDPKLIDQFEDYALQIPTTKNLKTV